MSHLDEELRKAVALFRYGLIADVLRLPPGSREIRRTLNDKAQRTYSIPGTRRTRVALETMRDWLSVYRNGGFEALYPKTRADRGRPTNILRPPRLEGRPHPRPALGRRLEPWIEPSLRREQQRVVVDAPEDEERLRGDVPEGVLPVEPLEPSPGVLRPTPVAERLARDRHRFEERATARGRPRAALDRPVEGLDDGARRPGQLVHETHGARGPGMADEAPHLLGPGAGLDRLGERAERAPVTLEGVGDAEPVDLDEAGLVLYAEPAKEEGGEPDIDTRARGAAVPFVKKVDGRVPELRAERRPAPLKRRRVVRGERDTVSEREERGQQVYGGGLHGSILEGGARARSGEAGTTERVRYEGGPRGGTRDADGGGRAAPERRTAPGGGGSRFAPGGLERTGGRDRRRLRLAEAHDRQCLGLVQGLDAEAPELASLEPPVRERRVALARNERRDRAHAHHPGKSRTVGAQFDATTVDFEVIGTVVGAIVGTRRESAE